MIKPKEIVIETPEDGPRTYILSKWPAVQGREIIAKYPISAMPKLGDYDINAETMQKLMAFVGVPRATDEPLMLTTMALINNHVPDTETLLKIEVAMFEYNVSFFGNGKGSTFLEAITQKAQAFLSKTLTDLSQQSSLTSKQP